MERPYLDKWQQYLNEQTTPEEKAASMMAWVNGYIKKHDFKRGSSFARGPALEKVLASFGVK